jgi:hypothetical protein
VVRQRHLGEHQLDIADLFHLDMGAVAGHVPAFFQALDPDQAGTWGQADSVGQVDVGNPAVLLEMSQDPDIDPVELE